MGEWVTGRRIINMAPPPTGEERKRRELVWNEQAKLFATWLNGIGIAIFAVGVLTPVVTALNSDKPMTLVLLVTVTYSFVTSMLAHLTGRVVLKRLK